MRLTHSETVATPIETVWDHFMDLRRVGRCFPGAEVTDVRGNEFDGTMKAGIGLITLSFAGHGKLTVADEKNHHAVIRSEGSDKRGLAKATIDIDLVLTEVDVSGRAGTRMDLTTDLEVRGLPTRLGERLAQAVSGPLVHQFLTCMGH